MKYLKIFEEYNKKSRKSLKKQEYLEDIRKKFEILLDSIVGVMDEYQFREYEEDDDWIQPDYPYYEYSYNYDGTYRQINVSNISRSDFTSDEILNSLLEIKPKLELRTGFNLTIEYYEDEDFIMIKPNLPKN